MKYRLLALDIDGTLTNSNKEITPFTREQILRLQKNNIPVLLVSGRPAPGIYPIADMLDFNTYGGYILAFNGGQIIHCPSGETVYSQTIPLHVCKQICELGKTLVENATLITYKDENIISERNNNSFLDIEAKINKMTVKKVDDLYMAIERPVNKFLVCAEPAYIQSILPVFKQKFDGLLNIFCSEPYFLEIVPTGIDKANSLEHLLTSLGMTKDDLVACGDGMNDITMIDYAGMGVAMANGCTNAKEVANYITDTNDNDGVGKAIEKFF